MKHEFITSLFVCLSLMACGSSSTTTPSSDAATSPTIASSLKLASNATAVASISGPSKSSGQVAADGLTSMKYYITSITICEDMDTTGTAFSNTTGCLELFSGNTSDSNYTYEIGDDYAPFGDVARGSDDGFIDLIDDTDRATLSATTTLTDSDVRSYNYGYITWYLPVKLTAEIALGNGSTFRTVDGTTETVDPDQGPITTAASNFSDAETAEEAVVVLGNGGSWFKFQNPFVISQSDIDANTSFSLDLTFNPDGLIKAYSSGVGGCGQCILKDPAGNQLLVPMINLTPVPHTTAQSVQVETYTATVSSGSDDFDIRIELYTIEGDADQTIYGIDTATLINDSTTTAVMAFPKISFIETEDDDQLSLEDYNGASGIVLSNFDRQSTVGESFIATLHCGDTSVGGFTADGCSDGETIEATFTLSSLSTLE